MEHVLDQERRALLAEAHLSSEHGYERELVWDADEQDYIVIYQHHDDCVACLMGIPLKEG